MAAFLLWCILFILCWPLALLALIAYPFVWLDLLAVPPRGYYAAWGLCAAVSDFPSPDRLLRGPSAVRAALNFAGPGVTAR